MTYIDDDPFLAGMLPDKATGEPFMTGTTGQTDKRFADIRVLVGGVDVTHKLNPYIINLHVDFGPPSPEIHLELDDRDGQLPLPPLGTSVVVWIGWRSGEMHQVFQGTTFDVEHGFGRKQGGRRMWVHAKGVNEYGTKMKTPFDNAWGEGAEPGQQVGKKIPFLDVMQDVMKSAGGSIKMDPSLGKIGRDFWAQGNESALHMGQRIAKEHGAIWNVVNGNQAEITKPGHDTDGKPGSRIVAKFYDGSSGNLIGYRVRPMSARGTWNSGSQKFYDTAKAGWQEILKQFNLPGPWSQNKNQASPQAPAANKDNAEQDNQGGEEATSSNLGMGRIVINGEPNVRLFDYVDIIGVRPGVDGEYLIGRYEHLWSRQGFVTYLDVYPKMKGSESTKLSIALQKLHGPAVTEPTQEPTREPTLDELTTPQAPQAVQPPAQPQAGEEVIQPPAEEQNV